MAIAECLGIHDHLNLIVYRGDPVVALNHPMAAGYLGTLVVGDVTLDGLSPGPIFSSFSSSQRRIFYALSRRFLIARFSFSRHEKIEHSMELDPLFLASIEEMIESSFPSRHQRIQEEMISLAARSLIERLYSLNQHIQLNADQVKALEAIYSNTWKRIIETRDIPRVLRSFHYPKLRSWVEQFYPESMRRALRLRLRLGHVPNEEYSAELQVKLLRLDISQMR